MALKGGIGLGETQTYSQEEVDMIHMLSEWINDVEREYDITIENWMEANRVCPESLNKIIEDTDMDVKTRYAAFFTACTIRRRKKEFTWCSCMLKEYQDLFKDFNTFEHLRAMYLTETANNKEQMLKAIEKSKAATKQNGNNAEILHSFAEAVVKAFEEGYFTKEENHDLLEQGLQVVNDAIGIIPKYPKFYFTKGRLQAILGQHKAARIQIKKAIQLEDMSKKNYTLKIGDYQKQLLNISYKENMEKVTLTINEYEEKILDLENKIKKAFKELEVARIRNIEFLGFFTALISFTIGAIQILDNQNFNDAFRLILVLCGGLMLVLGGFGIILSGSKRLKRSVVVWFMGTALILIASISALWI